MLRNKTQETQEDTIINIGVVVVSLQRTEQNVLFSLLKWRAFKLTVGPLVSQKKHRQPQFSKLQSIFLVQAYQFVPILTTIHRKSRTYMADNRTGARNVRGSCAVFEAAERCRVSPNGGLYSSSMHTGV